MVLLAMLVLCGFFWFLLDLLLVYMVLCYVCGTFNGAVLCFLHACSYSLVVFLGRPCKQAIIRVRTLVFVFRGAVSGCCCHRLLPP